ncbi:5-methylcytosine-specific restriction endonuclease system specificity protein McrC [Butyrivibrio fibrisolvens]|uniref:5-methylcytosine-specific restriction endonuclease system specificity protein McrC n=1 Tax=Butyrivibrio fibrisolvens TaxID=831 RepID=UPI0003B3314F|nr:5-methylcytosine-specific restriction endonuclease system specificity protein McrC [Butyrivibrio fibrisolvens]
MESNKLIPIKNLYYMLSYAFQVLKEDAYKNLAYEEFENAGELCAAILAKGLASQIKRGLERVYVTRTEAIAALKGRIEISESIKGCTEVKNQMVCNFDEFSVNSYKNQIVKTTAQLLLKSSISPSRKKELKKVLVYLSDVNTLDPYHINWKLQYNRNNQTYQMLIAISYLVVKGLLQNTTEGKTKMMNFFDEQRMCRLYEKFILEYYRAEHKELIAGAPQIQWALAKEDDFDMLPKMQTDITLKSKDGSTILVMDAKYYTHNTQVQFDKHSIHSHNLYQIFTYVKNLEAVKSNDDVRISGMLLYAKTIELIQPDNVYHMSGNEIAVKTLDLNQDFAGIRKTLDDIAERYFAIGNQKATCIG